MSKCRPIFIKKIHRKIAADCGDKKTGTLNNYQLQYHVRHLYHAGDFERLWTVLNDVSLKKKQIKVNPLWRIQSLRIGMATQMLRPQTLQTPSRIMKLLLDGIQLNTDIFRVLEEKVQLFMTTPEHLASLIESSRLLTPLDKIKLCTLLLHIEKYRQKCKKIKNVEVPNEIMNVLEELAFKSARCLDWDSQIDVDFVADLVSECLEIWPDLNTDFFYKNTRKPLKFIQACCSRLKSNNSSMFRNTIRYIQALTDTKQQDNAWTELIKKLITMGHLEEAKVYTGRLNTEEAYDYLVPYGKWPSYINIVEHLIKNKKYKAAIFVCEDISSAKYRTKALQIIAKNHIKQGRIKQALHTINDFQTISVSAIVRDELLTDIAKHYIEQKEYHQARDTIQKITNSKMQSSAQLYLGKNMAGNNQLDKALKLANELQKNDKNLLLEQIAQIYISREQPQKAEEISSSIYALDVQARIRKAIAKHYLATFNNDKTKQYEPYLDSMDAFVVLFELALREIAKGHSKDLNKELNALFQFFDQAGLQAKKTNTIGKSKTYYIIQISKALGELANKKMADERLSLDDIHRWINEFHFPHYKSIVYTYIAKSSAANSTISHEEIKSLIRQTVPLLEELPCSSKEGTKKFFIC